MWRARSRRWDGRLPGAGFDDVAHGLRMWHPGSAEQASGNSSAPLRQHRRSSRSARLGDAPVEVAAPSLMSSRTCPHGPLPRCGVAAEPFGAIAHGNPTAAPRCRRRRRDRSNPVPTSSLSIIGSRRARSMGNSNHTDLPCAPRSSRPKRDAIVEISINPRPDDALGATRRGGLATRSRNASVIAAPSRTSTRTGSSMVTTTSKVVAAWRMTLAPDTPWWPTGGG